MINKNKQSGPAPQAFMVKIITSRLCYNLIFFHFLKDQQFKTSMLVVESLKTNSVTLWENTIYPFK